MPLLDWFSRPHALLFPAVALSVFAAGSTLAAGPFDGTYSGSTKIITASDPRCAKDGSRVQMTVIDGQVSYNHFDVILKGSVAPDGSFTASGMNTRYRPAVSQSISGHITGTTAEGDIGTSLCSYHVTFRKL